MNKEQRKNFSNLSALRKEFKDLQINFLKLKDELFVRELQIESLLKDSLELVVVKDENKKLIADINIQYEMLKEVYRFLKDKDQDLYEEIQKIELIFYKNMYKTTCGINEYILEVVSKLKQVIK